VQEEADLGLDRAAGEDLNLARSAAAGLSQILEQAPQRLGLNRRLTTMPSAPSLSWRTIRMTA
jgi:hypothetical protein